MKILVTGATGFVGRNLVPVLLKETHVVSTLGRDKHKMSEIFGNQVNPFLWSELDALSPDDFDAVINLAGENIAQSRWSDARKKQIKESRINATKAIALWCAKATHKKPHLYNASAIGTYGLQSSTEGLPAALTESTPIHFGHPTDFLSEIGHAWETATQPAIDAGVPVTLMRFGVILERHEGMLKKLELPFTLGAGSVLGQGNQAISWIHINDVIGAILFLLAHPELQGVFNLSAPECVSQQDFAKMLAKTMHRPLFLKTPAFAIKLLFGEMGTELLLGGQRVYPQRLLQEGFQFQYPDLASALKQALRSF